MSDTVILTCEGGRLIAAGYAVAEASLASQAAHVIVASSSSEKVKSTVEKLQKAGSFVGKVSGATVNAKAEESVKQLMETVGEIDHLIWTSGDALQMGFPALDLATAKGEVA